MQMYFDLLDVVAGAHATIYVKSEVSAYLGLALPLSLVGQLARRPFCYLGVMFPRLSRMEPTFTGHDPSGCHGTHRFRDAYRWTAAIVGKSS